MGQCESGGGGALMTPGWTDGVFSPTQNTGTSHRWDVSMIWLDPLERPYWGTDFGDPRYTTCGSSIDTNTPAGFGASCNPKTWYQSFNALGRA
jgi:hypothetical protein